MVRPQFGRIDSATGQTRRSIENEEQVRSVTVSPSGRQLVVVGKEGSVRLLQVDSFTELVSISVGGKVKAVAVSRGGKMLATLLSLPGESEYYEGSARAQIWDVETGQEIARLDNVEGGSLAFSGDSRALLIALTRYDYGELWLWRPEATIAEVYKTAGRRLTEMEWADLGVSWEHQIFSP